MLPTAYRVAAKRRELSDTWTLELEPAAGDGVGEFLPGQFSMVYAFGSGEVQAFQIPLRGFCHLAGGGLNGRRKTCAPREGGKPAEIL